MVLYIYMFIIASFLLFSQEAYLSNNFAYIHLVFSVILSDAMSGEVARDDE